MKEETREEYERRVNLVIDYINAHLYEKPDLKVLTIIAGLSEFHLHRIFKFIVGENIGEFVLRIRLEDVAQCLRMTTKTLDDIAFEKGYASKSALSLAFKKYFGTSPSAYRKAPQDATFFDKRKNAEPTKLEPAIRHVAQKNLIYIRVIDCYGSPKSYANAWRQLGKYARDHDLVSSDVEFIGLSFDDPTITDPKQCRFYACFTCDEKIKPSGKFGQLTIDEGLYAVFLMKGSYRGFLDFYFNIYMNWLPSSKYTLRKMYAFEKYLNSPTSVKTEDLLTEIYVPIKPR